MDLLQLQSQRRLGTSGASPPDGGGPDDAKAERVTSDDVEDWFPHFSPNGKWLLIFGFPHGTENHGSKMSGVVLRLMPAPGNKLKPGAPPGAREILRRPRHDQCQLVVALFEEVRV